MSLSRLNKRDQTIIYMRYYLDYTQSDIAETNRYITSSSSRLEKKILAQMKTWMGADVEEALEKVRRP